MSKKVTSLSVVECQYSELGWLLDLENNRRDKITSSITTSQGPRESEDYRRCGLYYKAGVPHQVFQVEHVPTGGAEPYQSLTRSISDACYQALKEGDIVFMEGFCSFSVGVAGGIQRALGPDKKVGIVWLDAHSDMATPETSTSGLVAGMPLSTILGMGLDDWRLSAGITMPYDDSCVLLSDYRSKSPGADVNIAKSRITILDTDTFCDPAQWSAAVQALADKVDAIYFHVDCDFLDAKYVPGHVMPETGGPNVEVTAQNIRVVMETGKVVVFDMGNVYYDPHTENSDLSILTAMRLAGAGLESWKECGR